MKRKIIYVFITMLLIGTASCYKGPFGPFNYCVAILNDEVWHAAYANSYKPPYIGNEAINIVAKNWTSHYYSVHMGYIKKNHTKQQLKKPDQQNNKYQANIKFFSSQESDVIGDEYGLLESDSANNWVQIVKAKKNFTRDIEGKFSATLIRTKSFQGSPFPDTIRIREGYFYIAKVGKG